MEYKLRSHPEILLKDHLTQVYQTGMWRFMQNGIWLEYKPVMEVILAFHDIGKGSFFFQEYLLNQAPRSSLSRHSEFSALWGLWHCMNVLKLGTLECIWAYVCISSHHTDLGDVSELLVPNLSTEDLLEINRSINYDELNAILSQLLPSANLSADGFMEWLRALKTSSIPSLYRRAKKAVKPDDWLLLDYLFSILIWADKNSAIFARETQDQTRQQWQISYIDRYKINRLGPGQGFIDVIRNQAYESLVTALDKDSALYSMNMPTGSGKTINALKVAFELKRENPKLQRVIYSLPFTSIIDQNQKVFEAILEESSVDVSSELVLAHHHLAEFSYKGKNEFSSNESEFLIETWDSELIVTTFFQLLASFLSVKNSNLKRFHRLANAVIILDEVQNIPHHYWDLLGYTLELITQKMSSVVILVTATLPMIFEPSKRRAIELAARKDEWFAGLNRTALDCDLSAKDIDIEGLSKLIFESSQANPQNNVLIILNTVQSSIDLFNSLKGLVREEQLVYLSSNVIPKHRIERIKIIKDNPKCGLVIVSTQVVEAGVDIDVDIIYRDMAPLDSIIQAAGRCNRNDTKDTSRVVLFHLVKNQKPYWRYVYDETLVRATQKALEQNAPIINESALHTIANHYYEYLNKVTSSDKSRKIINQLTGLDLGTALRYHPKENPGAFNLIDDIPTQTVFVECDTEATEAKRIYFDFDESSYSDKYKMLADRKKITRNLSPYMINVDKRHALSEAPIHFIDKESLAVLYDKNTGFKRQPEQRDYIF